MSQAGPLEAGGGSGGSNVTQIDADTGFAVPIAGVINIFGGTGASTTASGNTVTINVTATGFTWNVVTSATNPNQIVASNGYICSGASQVVFLLPLAPNVGDTFKIVSFSSTFKITENGGQSMRIGTQITTLGSGTVTSNSVGDGVEFVYVGNNVFLETYVQGTLTVT